MNESFSQEQHNGDGKEFSWDIVKHTAEEDIVVHHGEGSEYDLETIKADTPGIAEHIKKLEQQGWKVVSKGDFVVLERDHKDGQQTVH
jgi:hypothetical protein